MASNNKYFQSSLLLFSLIILYRITLIQNVSISMTIPLMMINDNDTIMATTIIPERFEFDHFNDDDDDVDDERIEFNIDTIDDDDDDSNLIIIDDPTTIDDEDQHHLICYIQLITFLISFILFSICFFIYKYKSKSKSISI